MKPKEFKDMTENGKAKSKRLKGIPNKRADKYANNKESYYQKYLRATSWRELPPSQAMIDRLIEDMLNHVANPKITKIRPFFLERCLCEKLVIGLARQFPDFAMAHETAKQIIGERREDLAIYRDNNTNPQAILPTLRHYNPDWRKTQDETEKHEEKIGQKVVVIEQFSDDDESQHPNTGENNQTIEGKVKPTPEEVAKKAYRMGMHSNKKQLHIK